jgi:UDP-N-acetylmuramoylalanine--D-glutamate ligase
MSLPLSSQRIAVLGAGRSGIAAATLAMQLGAQTVVFDTSPAEKLNQSVTTLNQRQINHHLGIHPATLTLTPDSFTEVILSPGIDATWPLPAAFTRAGIPLTGEMEFAYRHCHTPLIAITGTNGKTTCTELIAAILNATGKRSIPCGNHGIPLSEILTSGQTYDVLSLEVSSFQLETIHSFAPAVRIWLNFADDHLDRYPNRQAYFDAKARMFLNTTPDTLAIVRHGENLNTGTARRISFSAFSPDADYSWQNHTFHHLGTPIGSSAELKLIGRHNMENVLAAIIATQAFGIQPAQALDALKNYAPAAHRCELIAQHAGRWFVNDSKATNVHATCACIQSLDQPIVLIAGGLDKQLDYSPLQAIAPDRLRAIVTIGDIAHSLAATFSPLLPTHSAGSMEEAVQTAFQLSSEGDAIVLSPTTSSFDWFKSYAHRGDTFRQAVQAFFHRINA